MTYNAIHRGRNKFRSKSHGRGQSSSIIHNCKYCGKSHGKGNGPAFGKKCQKCRLWITILNQCAEMVTTKDKHDASTSRHMAKKASQRQEISWDLWGKE